MAKGERPKSFCGLRCVLDLGVATWSSHGLVTMFRDQEVASLPHNAGYSLTSLDNIGEIVPYNVAALAAVTTLTFVLVAAGPRAIGKISLAVVPLCYGLLITLVIRACMDASGPGGFLAAMRPEWAALASVTAWLEAAANVIFSLQLGIGVLTTYGGYNKFGHSLVRDSCIIIFGQFCWVILSVLLVFSLRGVADSAGILQLPAPAAESVWPNSSAVARAVSVSVLGESVGVSTVVLALETLATLQHGWLWSALFSVLLVLVCITNILGYVEMVSTSISHHRPLIARFKPLVSLIIILSAGLVAVCFSTLGGVHVFSLLHSYISDWPLLLVTVLTTLAGTHCMSMSSVLKFLSIMSRRKLTNFTKSHLSVILVTVVPILISASLGWSLYVLSVKSQQPGSLPASWGLPVAWSLSALVVVPLLAGTLWYLTLGARGQMWVKHVRSILKPTSTWHRNQQLHYFGEDQTKIQSLAHS